MPLKALTLWLLLLIGAAAAPAQIRVGWVDASAIYDALPDMAAARTRIASASEDYQRELEAMRLEFQKKYAEYQAINTTATAEPIKERRVQELQELDQKIQRFVASAAAAMEQYQRQQLEPVEQQVRRAVAAVGDEGGYTIIYGNLSATDPSGAPSTSLQPAYMGSDVYDVTPQVASRLGITLSPASPAAAVTAP